MHNPDTMFCSFCKKGASKLVTHSLCDCCLVHLECRDATAEKSTSIVPKEDASRMVECDICLEECKEDEWQQHREMCMPRLVFHCAICDGDYLSKEGLWNHLDLHEIADESKDLHYQEMRATYKLHKCVLCNDQRGYQESIYWKHVHEEHDGFFLRCLECGESFRSQKLKTDHDTNHCKSREQTVPVEYSELEVVPQFQNIVLPKQVYSTVMDSYGDANQFGNATVDKLNLPQEEQSDVPEKEIERSEINLTAQQDSLVPEVFASSSVNLSGQNSALVHNKESDAHKAVDCDDLTSYSNEIVNETDNDKTMKESVVVAASDLNSKDVTKVASKYILQSNEQISSSESSNAKCPHCDRDCATARHLTRHIEYCHQPASCDVCGIFFSTGNQARYHKLTSHSEAIYKCSHCSKKFHMKHSFRRHLSSHVGDKKLSCEICSRKFKAFHYLEKHMRKFHHVKNFQADSTGGNEKEEQNHAETIVITDCPICGEHFSVQDKMVYHVKDIHKLTICISCGMTFASADQLNDHELTSHFNLKDYFHRDVSQHATNEDAVGSDPDVKKPSSKSSDMQCSQCKKECCDARDLSRHFDYCHLLIKCDICGITSVGKNQGWYHKLTSHSEPEHKCPHCPKKFHLKTGLRRHVYFHLNSKKAVCKFCGQKFNDLESVAMHIKLIHRVKKIKPDVVECNDPTQVQGACDVLDEEDSIKKENVMEETSLLNPIQQDQPECSFSYKNVVDDAHNEMANMKPKSSNILNLKSKNKRRRISEKFSKPLRENLSSRPSDTMCPHCHKEYYHKTRLSTHITWCHELTACDICGLPLTGKSQVWYHKLTIHSDPKFKCTYCPMKFHLKNGFRRHLSSHLKNSKVVCKICGKHLKDLESITDHMRQFHRGRTVQTDLAGCTKLTHEQGSCDDLNMLQGEKILFKEENTVEETSLLKPILQDQPECSLSIKNVVDNLDKGVIKKKSKASRIRNFKCTNKKTTVDKKISQTHGENPSRESCGTKCPHCVKECFNKTRLSTHITWCHKQIDCDVCGLSLAGKSQVGYHKLTVHSEPQFKCPHCSVKFHLKSSFQRHIISHVKDKKFSCKLCGRMFKNADYVSNHIKRVHHDRTDLSDYIELNQTRETQPCDSVNVLSFDPIAFKREMSVEESSLQQSQNQILDNEREILTSEEISQPVDKNPSSGTSDTTCPHCYKEFGGESMLTRHIEYSHNPATCNICGISTANKNQLWYHRLTSHSEPKHKCPHCLEKFHMKSTYRRHVSRHGKDSKTACKLCGVRFNNLISVSNHMRRIHPAQEDQNNLTDELRQERDSSSSDDGMNALQGEKIAVKEEITVEETSLQQHENQLLDVDGDVDAFTMSRCPICGVNFCDEDLLSLHIETFHQLNICIVCEITFSSADELKEHKVRMHQQR